MGQTLAGNILDCFVLQPTDGNVSIDQNNVRHLQEKWKGPYGTGEDLKFTIGTDTPETVRVKLVVSGKAPAVEYPCPGNLPGQKWWLESCKLDEIKAGDHCIITFTFVESSAKTAEGEMTKRQHTHSWRMTWQPYSVPVAEFCKNETLSRTEIYPDLSGNYTVPAIGTRSGTAYWPAIQKYLDANDKQLAGNFAYWNGDHIEALNDHEISVCQKYLLGRQPTYHYPVLEMTTGQSFFPTSADTSSFMSAVYEQEVGDKIDHEAFLSDFQGDAACPFEFPADIWHWIKIGDNVEQTLTNREKSFTHTIQLMGVKDFDRNFYGEPGEDGSLSGRWELNSI